MFMEIENDSKLNMVEYMYEKVKDFWWGQEEFRANIS